MKRLIKKCLNGTNRPNTFLGEVVKSFGGNYEKADQASSAISLFPAAGLVVGTLDLGNDLSGLRHGDKTSRDVVLDIFSILPGLRYARKINLLKKSTDPLMYYYKELNKYIRKHSDKINFTINSGKGLDLVEDATH